MEPELVGGSILPYSVAMVSPFDEAGEFLPGCVQPLVRHLVAAGAPGLLVSGSTVEQHCLSILTAVGLLPEADNRVSTYSGGMKRRLSVAIAALGQKKVIFLEIRNPMML